LATRTLEERAISTVYRGNDLYKDVSQVENVHKLEEDLSKLGCQAALVITDLHNSERFIASFYLAPRCWWYSAPTFFDRITSERVAFLLKY
jgi:hypothetical protein